MMNAVFHARTIVFMCVIVGQPCNPMVNALGCNVIKINSCDVMLKKTLKGIIFVVENVRWSTCRFFMVKPAIHVFHINARVCMQ